MNHLFYFFIILFSILISSLLISCTTIPQGCIQYTAFETCEQTYLEPIKCHKDGKEEVSLSKSEWEEKRIGRMSLSTVDVTEIKRKLKLLEIITCDEDEIE